MARKALAVFTLLVLLAAAFPLPGRAVTREDLGTYPFSAVAYMEIEFACGCTRTGTGAMIGRYGLLTAGHNLLCHKHNRPAKYIDFWFGYYSKSEYVYHYGESASFTYYCDFSDGYESEDDIGYVIFKKDVGNYTGWFGWRTYEKASALSGDAVRCLGYSGGTLNQIRGSLTVRGSKELSWRKSLYINGEGGPVFVTEGDEYYVVGVCTSFTDTEWYARRLTKGIIDDMKSDGAGLN